MSLLLDGFILLFIPLLAFRGYKRGAFLSICGFLMIFVAFWGASFLTNNLQVPVGRLIQPVVKMGITTVLEEALEETNLLLESPVDDEGNPEELPPNTQLISISYAFTFLENAESLSQLSGFIESAKDSLTENVEAQKGEAVDVISEFIGQEVARVALFFVSYLLITFIWALSSKTLNLVLKLPVLSQINGGIGAALGAMIGIFWVYIVIWITKGTIIAWDIIDGSFFANFFAYHSPLDGLAAMTGITLNL